MRFPFNLRNNFILKSLFQNECEKFFKFLKKFISSNVKSNCRMKSTENERKKNNSVLHIQNGVEKADIWFPKLQQELKWQEIMWGPTNRKLPRLCCPDIHMTSIGQEIIVWLKNFFLANFNTNIEIFGIWGNHYRNGNDYLPLHRDQYGDLDVISLSFGAKRKFDFVPSKTGEKKITYYLEHGDIIGFGNEMHKEYKHGISKQTSVKTARINLTVFVRYIGKKPY